MLSVQNSFAPDVLHKEDLCAVLAFRDGKTLGKRVPIVSMKSGKSPRTRSLKGPKSLEGLISSGRTLVVGTIHESVALGAVKKPIAKGGASRFPGIDVLEARLDSLAGSKLPESWQLPVIATARHPREGGAGNLSQTARRKLLEEALPWASAIDVELRSARALSGVIAGAHQHGRTVILSHHDFSATPSVSALKRLASRAADEGADLFKVATFLREPRDLQKLIELQSGGTKVPVISMGMGDAGRFSRVVLSGFGSPLCYGWLGKPQVSGQWPALKLRAILAEVLPS
jgi:3-dehydroquinate dehydratase-1